MERDILHLDNRRLGHRAVRSYGWEDEHHSKRDMTLYGEQKQKNWVGIIKSQLETAASSRNVGNILKSFYTPFTGFYLGGTIVKVDDCIQLMAKVPSPPLFPFFISLSLHCFFLLHPLCYFVIIIIFLYYLFTYLFILII